MLLSPAQLISKLFYQNTETTAEKKQQSKFVHAGTNILHELSFRFVTQHRSAKFNSTYNSWYIHRTPKFTAINCTEFRDETKGWKNGLQS